MPVLYGLLLVGALIFLLVLVRAVARREKQRRDRKRHLIQVSAYAPEQSARSAMRQYTDPAVVAEKVGRTGPHSMHPHNEAAKPER